jgi:hypothetical protein
VKRICISVLVFFLAFGARATLSHTTQPAQPTTRPAVVPADQLLTQMLKPAGTAAKPLEPIKDLSTLDKSTINNLTPAAPALNVLREGSFLVDRTGRLGKLIEGQPREFIFESDGQALRDPPVLILPNLKLMAMEDALAASSGHDLRFRISGILTEYRGHNYILLEKVVVVPEVNRQF